MHFKAKRVEQFNCGACGCSITSPEAKPLSTLSCPQCGVAVRVPVSFDRYLLTQALKKDSTGTTFRAIDTHLGRSVSIKVLRSGDDEADRLAHAAIETAKALAPIDHPNVARILTVGFFLGQHYIVSELATGGSLQDRIHADRQMEEKAALKIALGVARGLRAAHDEARLIHMNLKPSNILLGRENEPKIIEFSTTNRDPQGRERGVVGTPNYIAPEVVRGQPPEMRSDIYSFGVTLFYMLAGRLPFVGEDVMKQRLHQPAPSVGAFRQGLDDRTVALIDRCLQGEPADRFGDYAALIQALESAMVDRPVSPAPVVVPVAPTPSASASRSAVAAIAPPEEEQEKLPEDHEEPPDPAPAAAPPPPAKKSPVSTMEDIIRQMEMASWTDLDAADEPEEEEADDGQGAPRVPVHGSVEEAQEHVSALMGGLLDAVDEVGPVTVDAAVMDPDLAGSILDEAELSDEEMQQAASEASGEHVFDEDEQEVHALDAVISKALEDEAMAPRPTDALIEETQAAEQEEAAEAARPKVGQDLLRAIAHSQVEVGLADALGTIGDVDDQVVDEESIQQLDMVLADRVAAAPSPAAKPRLDDDDDEDDEGDPLDRVMDELGLPDAPVMKQTEEHPLAPAAGDDYLDDLAENLALQVSPLQDMLPEPDPEPETESTPAAAQIPPADGPVFVQAAPSAAPPPSAPAPAPSPAPAEEAAGAGLAAGLSGDRMARLRKTKIAKPVEEAPQPSGLVAAFGTPAPAASAEPTTSAGPVGMVSGLSADRMAKLKKTRIEKPLDPSPAPAIPAPGAAEAAPATPPPASTPQTPARLGVADGLSGDKMARLKKLKIAPPTEAPAPAPAASQTEEAAAATGSAGEGALGLVSGLSSDKMAKLKKMKLNAVAEETVQPKPEEPERPAAAMNADKLAKLKKMRLK